MTTKNISDLTEYTAADLRDLGRHFSPNSLEADVILPPGQWSRTPNIRMVRGKFHPFGDEKVPSDEYIHRSLGAGQGWREAESGVVALVVNGYRFDIAARAVEEIAASASGCTTYTPDPIGWAEPMEMRALGNVDVPASDSDFTAFGFQEEEAKGPVARGYIYFGWQNLIMTIRVSSADREVYDRHFGAMASNAEQIFANLIGDIRTEE